MKRAFFVLGIGRSGSTYLFELLRTHPEIALTNEAKVVDALCFAYEFATLPAGEVSATRGLRGVVSHEAMPLFSSILERHALEIVTEFYTHLFGDEFLVWGDKLPDAACAIEIGRRLDATKYIVLHRDPRDVMCSFRAFDARAGLNADTWSGIPLSERCRSWRDTYSHIFENTEPGSRLEVSYGELINRPRETVVSIVDFLDVNPHPELDTALARNIAAGGHATSSTSSSSIGRWTAELTEAETETIHGICGPLMTQLGYE